MLCAPCGTYIDAVYDITAVVRQDPWTEEVAIVWGHPIFLDGDPSDPCGFTQWQNDVYVWKSFDCGLTWNPDDIQNNPDCTQGGTIPINMVRQLFYTDLSAVYDRDGTAAFCNQIPGAIVLDNATWVYPNSGYDPCRIGALLARHSGFVAMCDSAQDLHILEVLETTDSRNGLNGRSCAVSSPCATSGVSTCRRLCCDSFFAC